MNCRCTAVGILLVAVVAAPAWAQERARVLVIGIDGTRPDALAVAQTPNIDELAAMGAAGFNLRTGEYTISGPAWSAVLTGVGHEKHGVVDNSFTGAQFDAYPHVFRLLAQKCANLQTRSFIAWAVLNHRVPSGATRLNWCNLADADIAHLASESLAGCNPDVTFVHFLQVDEAGHGYDFSPESPEYLAAIERVDEHVGQLLAAVFSRPDFFEESWLVIVTTDHGGIGRHHGGTTPEETTIFMIVSGPACLPGPLNQQAQLVDVVPTVFDFLGVSVESNWDLDGFSVGLDPNRPMVDFPCVEDAGLVHTSSFNGGLCHWNVPLEECLVTPALVWDFEP